jgi:cell division protein FtsZ
MDIISVREIVQPDTTPVTSSSLENSYQDTSYQDTAQQDTLFTDACFDEPPPAVIKVVGAGGGGSNAVNRMIESGLSGVEFIAVNTDAQDLRNKSKAPTRLQIGAKVTGGRGAGGKPEVGENAAKEDYTKLSEAFRGADMVFLTAGMGGGTGTGSISIMAKIARELGALTVAVVTKPFEYEAPKKMRIAEEGIRKLREEVDTLIVIPNEHMFKVIDRNMSLPEALLKVDDVLRQGVQGISDLITKTGEVNIDFADVASTMRGQGDALMGIGKGTGDNRAKEAADKAIDNPLLEDTTIEGATRLLINIGGPERISPFEIKEIMQTVKAKADPDVEIIHGVTFDSSLGDSIQVTVIATGFRSRTAAEMPKAAGKNAESADTYIDFERFQKMRGQNVKHPNESYGGIIKQGNYYENLEVPTAIRRYNLETGS